MKNIIEKGFNELFLTEISKFDSRKYAYDTFMLTPHLRKMNLPLPFITRYDLEKDGYKILSKAQ